MVMLKVKYTTVMSVYSAAFALLYFCILYFIPLSNLGKLYTTYQDPLYTDATYYLYNAYLNCTLPPSEREFSVTWSSAGVVRYLFYTCKIGGDFGFIAANTLLFFISTKIYLSAMLQNFKFAYSIYWILSPFLLYSYCFLIVPGKEILSYVSICTVSAAVIYFCDGARCKALSLMSIGLAISAVNRFHEAIILLGLLGLFMFMRRYPKVTFSCCIAVVMISDMIIEMLLGIDPSVIFNYEYDYKSELENTINALLLNDNSLLNLILAPVRMLVLLIGPYYNFFTTYDISNSDYFTYRVILQKLRYFDLTILLAAIIFALKYRKHPEFIGAFIALGFIFVLTWGGILEKTRYVFLYAPILMPYLILRYKN